MESQLDQLESVLARHPDAWVAAMGPDMVYVPIPDGLPVAGHQVMQGRWTLDHVAASNRPALTAAWRDRLETSEVCVSVELLTGDRATFRAYDLTATHDVIIVVAIPEAGADLTRAIGQPASPISSRFCRMRRDIAGRILEADDAAAVLLGWPDDDLTKRDAPLNYIHPDDHGVVLDNWMTTLSDPDNGHRCRLRYLRADGSWMWVELTNYNRLDDPHRPGVISEVLDISEEMAAHDEVRAREQLLHRLAEALPLGVLQFDPGGDIVYRNDYLARLLGQAEATTVTEQFASAVDEDRPRVDAAVELAFRRGEDDDVPIRILHPEGGDERIVRLVTKALRTDGGEVTGVIACVTDVTEAVHQERELEQRASRDTLTGCFNHSSILGRVDDALRGGQAGTGVIFVDLDRFKSVNDGHGHAVGDEVLKAAAAVLRASVRDGDTVGRLGGDEFLVVCHDVRSAAETMDVAARIVERLGGCQPIAIRASVGVAWTTDRSLKPDRLVALADQAMYRSKREGQGRPHLALAG